MGGQLGFLCKVCAGVGVYSCGGSWRREKDFWLPLKSPSCPPSRFDINPRCFDLDDLRENRGL